MSQSEDYEKWEEIEEKIEILEEKNKLENIPLKEKYYRVNKQLREIISVRYIKRKMNICSIFYDKNLDSDKDLDLDIDADTDTDTDTDRDRDRDDIFPDIYDIDLDTDTDTDLDLDIDTDSEDDIDRDIERVKAMEKFIRKDLYMNDLYYEDENICEQVYIEADNDIYDVN